MSSAVVVRRVASSVTWVSGLVICLAATFAFGVGANRFVDTIRDLPSFIALEAPADGVVALTGGPDRIGDAAGLLAAGQARRMLISGVNQATTRADIVRGAGKFERWIECCADIGYLAENTRGNAIETAAWAKRHSIQSLIVVTADYHMPRAVAELRQALPEARLIAHPVRSPRLEPSGWWRDLDTIRLVGMEYAKYLRTLVRAQMASRWAKGRHDSSAT